jgi:hypothetical protein
VSAEEGMTPDLFRSSVPESMSRISVEQTDEEGAGLGGDFVGEAKGLLKDLTVHLIRVLVVEGREAGELGGVRIGGEEMEREKARGVRESRS